MDIALNGVAYLAEDDGESVSYYSQPGRVFIGRAMPCLMTTQTDLFRLGQFGESVFVGSVEHPDEPEDIETIHRANIKALLSTADIGL